VCQVRVVGASRRGGPMNGDAGRAAARGGSCPRCGGYLLLELDGWTCLQCGWVEVRVPAFIRGEVEGARGLFRRRRLPATRRGRLSL